ncbi:MAG: hypothetical protein ACK55O_05350 [Phycisphaerales bacterium]|jgi:hypothetical protein|nr:hypothetical protein [Phycisphaeraceae bacterium]MTA11653.1 hypothetical protein [Actinomycetota bacterium]
MADELKTKIEERAKEGVRSTTSDGQSVTLDSVTETIEARREIQRASVSSNPLSAIGFVKIIPQPPGT